MVSLSVMYPATPGSTFNWNYYLGPHLALAGRLLMPFGHLRTEINRGIGGVPPGTAAPYHAIAHLYFATRQGLECALAETAPALIADQRKYYSGESVVQVNEIVENNQP